MNHPAPRHVHAGPRRFFIGGFVALFGGLAFLFFAGIGAVFLLTAGKLPFGSGRLEGGRLVALACLAPLIFFVLAAALGNVWLRRFVRPFIAIMGATEAVARGDLSVRLRETGPRPVIAMARSFNRMVAELGRAEQQRRNLTADIAHELRTPLHVIQGNLEGMLDGVYEPNADNLGATLDETRLLARLVADLQTLSLAETGQLPLHPTRFAAADLLADVAASFAARAAEQEIALQTDAEAGIELLADYDRLDQVLSNLVANALRYTPAGGRVALACRRDAGQALITVSDTGPGVPAEDLPFIFDRFWKGDRARTRDGAGSGLGLAIARQLVEAQAGAIAAENRPTGGLQVSVTLPLA